MRIAGMKQDSTVDGPGVRFVVLLQGCLHHCSGCQISGTDDSAGGVDFPMDELVDQMLSSPLTDGLTLSGGEPFEHPEDCTALAREAHRAGLNVWCWTGGIFETLRDHGSDAQKALLQEVDVLVDGPFLPEQRTQELPWRSSGNQRVILVPDSLRQGQTVLWEV